MQRVLTAIVGPIAEGWRITKSAKQLKVKMGEKSVLLPISSGSPAEIPIDPGEDIVKCCRYVLDLASAHCDAGFGPCTAVRHVIQRARSNGLTVHRSNGGGDQRRISVSSLNSPAALVIDLAGCGSYQEEVRNREREETRRSVVDRRETAEAIGGFTF